MVSWKVNGKKVLIPGCYEELSTGLFQRIVKQWDGFKEPDPAKRDYFRLFCIMVGIDFKPSELSSEVKVSMENAIDWFAFQPYEFPTELPKVLKLGRQIIAIPRNIGELGIGQNIFLRQIIDKSTVLEENISMAVATYLQPIYDNSKFDTARVEELEKEIAELPIHITYPIGFFLLRRADRSGWKHVSAWRQILHSLKQNLKTMWPKWPRPTSSAGSMTSR